MTRAPAILLVHQGSELYGSDRTFVQSVRAMVRRWPEAKVTVLLPSDGPLRPVLTEIVTDVRVVDLGILRKRDLKRDGWRALPRLLGKVRTARAAMRGYDVTYVNTAVVLDHIVAAGVGGGRTIVHVHEIPGRTAAAVFSTLLAASRATILFNSHATARAFRLPRGQRRATVWNGVAAPTSSPAPPSVDPLNLLVIGRFNAWKGQTLLLEAVALLSPEHRARIRVRLVGGVFEDQTHFADAIAATIRDRGLAGIIEVCPFVADPAEHYAWASLVVVPSTKPEPFGLVAVEAMAAGRAVLGADHGGLAEIVIDAETGTLAAPGDAAAFARAIIGYLDAPDRLAREAAAGRARFLAEFEERRYEARIADLVAAAMEG